MMNHASDMNRVSSRSVCPADTKAYFAFTNAACYFGALRFYFYYFFYFTGLHSSERQQIS